MKTRDNELTQAEIADLRTSIFIIQNELHLIQTRMENILTYGIDSETGMLTKFSERDYDSYQKMEKKLIERLNQLELQFEMAKPSLEHPTKDDDYDDWSVVEQEEQALKEFRETRQSGEKENENDLER